MGPVQADTCLGVTISIPALPLELISKGVAYTHDVSHVFIKGFVFVNGTDVVQAVENKRHVDATSPDIDHWHLPPLFGYGAIRTSLNGSNTNIIAPVLNVKQKAALSECHIHAVIAPLETQHQGLSFAKDLSADVKSEAFRVFNAGVTISWEEQLEDVNESMYLCECCEHKWTPITDGAPPSLETYLAEV